MITKFKIFETISLPIKVGDYVLIDYEQSTRKEIRDFYSSNICKVIKIGREHGGSNLIFTIKFDKGLPGIISDEMSIQYYKIKCWSDNKEELEALITSKKYNL